MSLLKRLLLSVTLAIAIILTGTLAWSVIAARQYLDGQLLSESDNAASSLALSLSQPGNQDPVTRELLMTALFDTGKFRAIRFTNPEGAQLFERQQTTPATLAHSQAPNWFVQLLPLQAPKAQRAVSDGWRQVGQIHLTVANSYAYEALWRSSTRMAALVLGAGLAWAFFVVGLLQWFRRMLQQEVEAQVLAIGGQNTQASPHPDASTAAARPLVAELQSVVSAIAATRARVRATTQEQDERIESLQLELHSDPATGLANRRYFINELRRVLSNTGAQHANNGHLLLFRQRDLLAVNAQLNHAGADAWLAATGAQIKAVLTTAQTTQTAQESKHSLQLARLNGSDFIVLIPQLPGPQAMTLVEQIRQVLQATRVLLADGHSCRWAYALTDYEAGDSVAQVLTRLDQALMRAESAGHGEVEFLAHDEGQAAGKTDPIATGQWQQLLHQALDTPGLLALQTQPLECTGQHGHTEQQEASLLLHPPGGKAPLGGALFLPVAVRLGLSAEFDLQALRLGLQWLQQHPLQRLVLRTSLPSLAQASFLPQASQQLQEAPPELRHRLILELDAHALEISPEEVTDLAAQLQSSGAGLGLRRLDQAPMALAQIHQLRLHYVKLGGVFAEQAQDSPGLRQLLLAMLHTLRQLGIAALVPTTVAPTAAALLHEQGAQLLDTPEG